MKQLNLKVLHKRVKETRGYLGKINERLAKQKLRTYTNSYIVQVMKGEKENMDVIEAALWLIEQRDKKAQRIIKSAQTVLKKSA